MLQFLPFAALLFGFAVILRAGPGSPVNPQQTPNRPSSR